MRLDHLLSKETMTLPARQSRKSLSEERNITTNSESGSVVVQFSVSE